MDTGHYTNYSTIYKKRLLLFTIFFVKKTLHCFNIVIVYTERERKQIAQKRQKGVKDEAFLFRLAIRIKDFGEQKRKPWLIRLGLRLKWRVMQ